MTARWSGATILTWVVLSALLAATDARPAVLVLGGAIAVASSVLRLGVGMWRDTRPVGWTTRRGPTARVLRVDERVEAFGRLMDPERQRLSNDLVDVLDNLIGDRAVSAHPLHTPRGGADEIRHDLRRMASARRRRVLSGRDIAAILNEIEAR